MHREGEDNLQNDDGSNHEKKLLMLLHTFEFLQFSKKMCPQSSIRYVM